MPPRYDFQTLSRWVIKTRQACIAEQVIECLVDENRVLREEIANQRISLTDDQRGRLAANAGLSARIPHFRFLGNLTTLGSAVIVCAANPKTGPRTRLFVV